MHLRAYVSSCAFVPLNESLCSSAVIHPTLPDPILFNIPEELWLKIFQLHIMTWKSEAAEGDDRPTRGYYGWMPSILHVCRYWRKIALDAPTLWTDIAILRPESLRALLEWSKEATLVVDALHTACIDLEQLRAMLELVLLHSRRIRELSLDVSHPGLGNFMKRHIFSRLVTLHLQSLSETDHSLLPFIAEGDDACPRLETLVIASCSLSPFRPLLRLCLKTLVVTHDSELTWPDMLDCLVNTPALETLAVDVIRTVRPAPLRPIVPLARLHHLRIKGCGSEPAALLSHLTVPADATTELSVQFPLVGPEGADSAVAAAVAELTEAVLWRLFKGGQIGVTAPLRVVCVECPDAGGVEFRAYTEDDGLATGPILGQEDCRPLLRISFSGPATSSFFDVFCPSFPWSSVRFLSFGMENNTAAFSIPTARLIAKEMTSLKVLHLRETANILAPAVLLPTVCSGRGSFRQARTGEFPQGSVRISPGPRSL